MNLIVIIIINHRKQRIGVANISRGPVFLREVFQVRTIRQATLEFTRKRQNLVRNRIVEQEKINFKNLTWRKCKIYKLIVDYIFILSEK